MKIIIVDDDKDFNEIVKSILSHRGHEVIIDPQGYFIDGLGDELPDLIILDINLRNRDGGDICAKLKHQDHTKNIPIILISAIMDLKQISQLCGAEDYLNKPFERAELENKVGIQLEKHQSQK